MALHWHAYSFNLAGGEIQDAKGNEDLSGFRTLEHPSNRLVGYLKKAPSMIRATFTDPDEALNWFVGEYRSLPRLLNPDADENGVPFLGRPDEPERLAASRQRLLDGHDVAWSFWVVNVRRIDFRLICCPNRVEPDVPCPQGAAMAR